MFGAARPPPLPEGGIVSSGAPVKKKKPKATPETKGKKEGKKKKIPEISPIRIGVEHNNGLPPPPKFLYNGDR